ncbi:MAG: hypothetical protein EP329_23205 [Deltaproteobacteria bacterium]|nr:MAG: hypothetical protein EP329_23205 [Deltaproteobacteria bacterium]
MSTPTPRESTRTQVLSVGHAAHESTVPRNYDRRNDDPEYVFTPPPSDVFVVAGEYEPVQALILALADDAIELIPRFVDIIEAGQREARVVILYSAEATKDELLSALAHANVELLDVELEQVPLDSSWVRDYGPVFALTKAGDFRIIDTRYYDARPADDAVPTRVGDAWGFSVSRPPLVAEGGNLLFDGHGRCVVSDEVLVRNDVWEISELQDVYASYFGCTQVTVLPALAGEGTGHVDMFVTITGPGEAMVGAYLDGADLENAERLEESAALLRDAGFTVRRVPMPTNQDGRFRSYTNALAINGSVLVPIYRDDRRYEERALAVFAEAYPERRIIPIDSTELIQWSGSIHCLTMTVTR